MMLGAFPFTLLFCIINFHLIKCGRVINKSYDIFSTPPINDEPIIGILSQETSSYLRSKYPDQSQSYIAASYVKFVEGAGARVVPLMIGQDRGYYESMMLKINGVLFPGGGSSFTKRNGYAEAARHIYTIASEMNKDGDYFPLWGTCLGFELLTVLSANESTLTACEAESLSIPLKFKKNFRTSRLFKCATDNVITIFKEEPVTANFHKFCVTEQSMKDLSIDSLWRVLSVNDDWKGFRFVSTIEHRQYPFYGVQFHPEKNIYEWVRGKNISHTANAITASNYFAEFFVNEARKSGHHFTSGDEENRYLIYNYNPSFSGAKGSAFEQVYLFQ